MYIILGYKHKKIYNLKSKSKMDLPNYKENIRESERLLLYIVGQSM